MMRRLLLTSTVVLCLAARSTAAPVEVTFKAADGFVLKGTFYPAQKGGPAILLLHQCNADRRVYEQLATMLNTAAYNVLAFDFRGFGGSKAEGYTDFDAQRLKFSEKMPGDIDAALAFLTSQTSVNNRALGIVAGSCGVHQAVLAAKRHPEIKTLVLLSGATDSEGEAFVKNAAGLPILGVASEEETADAAATKKIVALSTNTDSRFTLLKGAGHAAFMFEKQPELQADIVIWFRSNLPPAGYGLPPAIR